MKVTVAPRRMPDGTVCRTGPTCKRHGSKQVPSSLTSVNKQLEAARKAVTDKINSLPLPKGASRVGQNTSNPDWAKPLYDLSREVEEKLTNEQESTLSYYKMGGYIEINGVLRGGEEGYREAYYRVYDSNVSEETVKESMQVNADHILKMDKAFEHEVILPSGTLLYRAIKIDSAIPEGKTILEHVAENYTVGSVIEDKGFASTSADPDYMSFFGRKRIKEKGAHMVFEIVAKKGLPVVEEMTGKEPHLPHNSKIQSFEREVLLNRGSRFRVVGVKNITFKHSYPENLRGWMSRAGDCPKRVTFPVVQLEQL